MSTSKQQEANQANALKSTGPKTAQGKAKARRNAIKHGMTSKNDALFAEDEKLYKDRLERWTKAAKPQNDLEVYQLESAVRATVNLDRCARNEKAELSRRERKVRGDWEGVQTKKVKLATEHWTTQPAACVAELELFARGVEWLLARWEELAEILEAKECWSLGDFWLAMRLMGKCPEMPLEGDSEVAAFRSLVVAVLPEIVPDDVDLFLGIDTSQLEPEARQAQLTEKLPIREDALEGLWATLDAELERLEAIRDRLWEGLDGPALAQKIDSKAFDSSKTGVLRRRYVSANHLDMHRCLKQLTEQRKQHAIRVEEEREIEEKAIAKEAAARRLKVNFEVEQRQRARLRNEAKSSAAKDNPVSTSGKSADDDPRAISDPARVLEKVLGAKAAASLSPRPSNPGPTGADGAQKPS
jgi:hypothetical protein